MRAMREAATLGHLTTLGIGDRVLQDLALTNGPTIGPEANPQVPLAGALWWGTTVALAVVAVVRTRASPSRGAVLCAILAGWALAAEYLVFISGLAPRFLLPAYALLSLPTAVGLVSLLAGGAAHRVAGAAAVAVLAGLTVWQVGTARTIGTNAAAARASVAAVGGEVRRLASGRPCVVASGSGFPQVAFASGCAGRGLAGTDAASLAALRASVPRSDPLFVVLPTSPPAGSPLGSLPLASIREGWVVFELTPAT